MSNIDLFLMFLFFFYLYQTPKTEHIKLQRERKESILWRHISIVSKQTQSPTIVLPSFTTTITMKGDCVDWSWVYFLSLSLFSSFHPSEINIDSRIKSSLKDYISKRKILNIMYGLRVFVWYLGVFYTIYNIAKFSGYI